MGCVGMSESFTTDAQYGSSSTKRSPYCLRSNRSALPASSGVIMSYPYLMLLIRRAADALHCHLSVNAKRTILILRMQRSIALHGVAPALGGREETS